MGLLHWDGWRPLKEKCSRRIRKNNRNTDGVWQTGKKKLHDYVLLHIHIHTQALYTHTFVCVCVYGEHLNSGAVVYRAVTRNNPPHSQNGYCHTHLTDLHPPSLQNKIKRIKTELNTWAPYYTALPVRLLGVSVTVKYRSIPTQRVIKIITTINARFLYHRCRAVPHIMNDRRVHRRMCTAVVFLLPLLCLHSFFRKNVRKPPVINEKIYDRAQRLFRF